MADIDQLAQALQKINTGEISGAEARLILENIDPVELSLAEQRLIEQGTLPHELRGLCAAHLAVLGSELEKIKVETGPGHPIHTLVSEHDDILSFLDQLEEVQGRLTGLSAYDPSNKDFETLKYLAGELVEAEKHHAREEDVLFPEMERRGITGPPRIMRLEHDDLRPNKRHLLELAEQVPNLDYEEFKRDLNRTAEFIIFNMRDHIFKENTILYPAALKAIPEPEVWERLKAEADAIGYCCFTPGYLSEEKKGGSTEKMQVIKLGDLPITTSPRGPRIRRVLEEPAVAITNVLLEPGQELPAHKTPVDVVFYVHEGRGSIIIGDQSANVAAGDLVFSPKNIPHGLLAARDSSLSVLVIKTPNPTAKN